jgi:hypothetical protein
MKHDDEPSLKYAHICLRSDGKVPDPGTYRGDPEIPADLKFFQDLEEIRQVSLPSGRLYEHK